jgi:hypothetical protein
MHCELVVPGLFAAAGAARLPALELLLARGRCTSQEPRSLEEWLQQTFGVPDEPLAAGALTLLGAGGEPSGYRWARADPVHLQLLRDRLVLVPAAALGIARAEGEALRDALNAHFGERLELRIADTERWVAKLAQAEPLGAQAPLALAGRDVASALPAASGSAAHRLLNEAQMVLHSHPVNEAREARGAPAVNSVWLWGGAALPRLGPPRWHSVTAADPLVLGFGRAAGIRHRALAARGDAWLERAPDDGRHLVVLDALRVPLALGEDDACRLALSALERDWFAPLLGALRAGRIGMLTIQVPDAPEAVAVETIRGDLRRFWRRPKALARYA